MLKRKNSKKLFQENSKTFPGHLSYLSIFQDAFPGLSINSRNIQNFQGLFRTTVHPDRRQMKCCTIQSNDSKIIYKKKTCQTIFNFSTSYFPIFPQQQLSRISITKDVNEEKMIKVRNFVSIFIFLFFRFIFKCSQHSRNV